jgi:hypothetical protein
VATVRAINAQSEVEIAYFRFAVETNKAFWVEISAIFTKSMMMRKALSFAFQYTWEPLQLCENLCEKNFPKSAKISKNRKRHEKSYLTNSIGYNNLRSLGNSEALSSNP